MKLNDINHSMAVASSKFIGFWEGLRILANGLISERFPNQINPLSSCINQLFGRLRKGGLPKLNKYSEVDALL